MGNQTKEFDENKMSMALMDYYENLPSASHPKTEFLMELFERTQMIGLSNLIDSNGSYPFYDSEYLLENCQGVMLDIKAWGALEYQQVTGAVRPHIPKNVMYLYEAGKLEELRISDYVSSNIDSVFEN